MDCLMLIDVDDIVKSVMVCCVTASASETWASGSDAKGGLGGIAQTWRSVAADQNLLVLSAKKSVGGWGIRSV
jgi:hypothetical protein